MTKDYSAEIETLMAKDAIRELVLSYCTACDRGDVALLRSLYFEDAGDEHGANPSGTAKEFLDLVPQMVSGMRVLQHNVTNHSIRVSGDEAEGDSHIIAYHSFDGENGPVLLITGGRYLDRYRRRDGIWKFAHRRCISDWVYEGPLPATKPSMALIEALQKGRIGPDDPSYQFFTMYRRGERT